MVVREHHSKALRDNLSRQPPPQLNPVELQPLSDHVVANLENTLFASLAPHVGHSTLALLSSIPWRASNNRPHL
jgi:hypothetical protein